jgi:hypothetical protein
MNVVKGIGIAIALIAVWTAFGFISGKGLLGEIGLRPNPTVHISASEMKSTTLAGATAEFNARVASACSVSLPQRLLFGKPDSVEVVATDIDGTVRSARVKCSSV